MDKQLVNVVAGIIHKGDKFLACQRPQGKPLAGFWEFPGGKVESGEKWEGALQRELREELGISIRECKYFRSFAHETPEKSIVLHFYDVFLWSGEPRSRENQKMLWVTPSDAMLLEFLPTDAELLKLLAANG